MESEDIVSGLLSDISFDEEFEGTQIESFNEWSQKTDRKPFGSIHSLPIESMNSLQKQFYSLSLGSQGRDRKSQLTLKEPLRVETQYGSLSTDRSNSPSAASGESENIRHLEWDSGADLGYVGASLPQKSAAQSLSALEKLTIENYSSFLENSSSRTIEFSKDKENRKLKCFRIRRNSNESPQSVPPSTSLPIHQNRFSTKSVSLTNLNDSESFSLSLRDEESEPKNPSKSSCETVVPILLSEEEKNDKIRELSSSSSIETTFHSSSEEKTRCQSKTLLAQQFLEFIFEENEEEGRIREEDDESLLSVIRRQKLKRAQKYKRELKKLEKLERVVRALRARNEYSVSSNSLSSSSRDFESLKFKVSSNQNSLSKENKENLRNRLHKSSSSALYSSENNEEKTITSHGLYPSVEHYSSVLGSNSETEISEMSREDSRILRSTLPSLSPTDKKKKKTRKSNDRVLSKSTSKEYSKKSPSAQSSSPPTSLQGALLSSKLDFISRSQERLLSKSTSKEYSKKSLPPDQSSSSPPTSLQRALLASKPDFIIRSQERVAFLRRSREQRILLSNARKEYYRGTESRFDALKLPPFVPPFKIQRLFIRKDIVRDTCRKITSFDEGLVSQRKTSINQRESQINTLLRNLYTQRLQKTLLKSSRSNRKKTLIN